MHSIGIIPARYASTRFPGKPLARLGDKTLIQHVYERARQTRLDAIIVATDDARIYQAVEAFGGTVRYSRADHSSGTDRCAEVAATLAADVIVNIQGDEPFFSTSAIDRLLAAFSAPTTHIATLVCPLTDNALIHDPNVVKVVADQHERALYFSRSPIPYVRDLPAQEWNTTQSYLQHIGIYAFRAAVLQEITRLPVSPLERLEALEQLRWLQAGYTIQIVATDEKSIGVDTPADLEVARQMLLSQGMR